MESKAQKLCYTRYEKPLKHHSLDMAKKICGNVFSVQCSGTGPRGRGRGVIIVYDIANESSFENVKWWMKHVQERTSTDVVKILVGNKCRKEDKRSVSKERGEQLATEYGIKLFEASPNENINIDEEQRRLQAASSNWVVRRPRQSKGFLSSVRDFAVNLGRKSATLPPSPNKLLKEQQLKVSDIKVKDVPDSVICELAGGLIWPRDVVEKLAGLIGFSSAFKEHLKTYPKEAMERLLIQWGESEPDATVFELYTMLNLLDRHSAASVLLLVPLKIQSSTVPPEILARGALAFEAYNNALREGRTCVKRVPIMLIGQDRSGKTSLKKSLKGQRFTPDEDSTVGIDKDPSHFKVTTEIWKAGEKGEATNSDAAISYAHHAAQLIVSNLTEEKRTPTEGAPKSGSSSLTSVHQSPENRQFASNENKRNPAKRGLERGMEQDQSGSLPITNGDSVQSRKFPFSSSEAPNRNVHYSKTTVASRENRSSSPSEEPKVPDEIAALVEKLLLEVNKAEEEQDIHSVLWDFGGQSVYYVTHPLFLTPRAMYLLIYDLSRNPYDKANPIVKQGMFTKMEDHFSLRANMDYLDFWMTSVASLSRQDEVNQEHPSSKYEALPERLPPVFLVCTHADKPHGGGDPVALAHDIFQTLQKKPYSGQLVERVFVVDNTKSGSESECEEVIRLRQDLLAVAKELPQMKEDIPIKWLKYEKALQVTGEEKGLKWITLETAKQIAFEVCGIDDDQEFLTLLNFLHDQRFLIHFDDTAVLNNLVVLDPQWLINVFKKVITVKPYDGKEREFKDLWCKLETTGIMEETLLEHVWNPLLKKQETFDSLVAIMQKFSLLCPLPSSDASCSKQYLVPSMLMSHPPQEIINLVSSAQIPSLFLKLESAQIPPSFFPRLVLQFFQWFTEEFPTHIPPQLFDNFARFYIPSDTGCSVVLLCHLTAVEVVFLSGGDVAESSHLEVNVSAEVSHVVFDVTSACVVRNQLALMIDSMRDEFCWLKNTRCEVSFLCPVCSKGGAVDFCRNHRAQACKQEECLHFFSESELLKSKQIITCTRSATAQDNRVQIKQFTPWFAFERGQHQPTGGRESMTNRMLPSVQALEIQQHQDIPFALPCDVPQTLQSPCSNQDVAVKLEEHLQLDESSLIEPDPDAKKWIRCLATEAKRSDRLDVVKHPRDISAAGSSALELKQQQDNALALPCDVLQTLQSPCSPQDVVVQLQEHLQLDESSLNEPDPETQKWIRCLAKEAKRSDRLDVVKHLRDISPAGTTGPLLNEHLDARCIPFSKRTDLAVHLCGDEQWKMVAERLGFSYAYICCFDSRFRNPFEIVLRCCDLTVGELYDVLVECGFPVFADIL